MKYESGNEEIIYINALQNISDLLLAHKSVLYRFLVEMNYKFFNSI
jgi:hypothetical protein